MVPWLGWRVARSLALLVVLAVGLVACSRDCVNCSSLGGGMFGRTQAVEFELCVAKVPESRLDGEGCAAVTVEYRLMRP
jgi:hypothetical protein